MACPYIEKQYLINDLLYTIVESKETHARINNDPEFATQFVKDNSSQLEFQVPNTNENLNDNTFVWTQSTIRLLLNEYEKRKDKFRSPIIKKKLLWTEIKSEFQKLGHNINSEGLDKKFRNLKKTYLKIYDNNKKINTGRGTVTWEYYHNFLQIFESDKAISMDNTLSSMAVISENNKIVNPSVLDLPPLDLTAQLLNNSESDTIDADDPDINIEPVHNKFNGNNKKRKAVNQRIEFQKDMLEVGKQRLQESKKLRISLDEMIEIHKKRNNILKELANKV